MTNYAHEHYEARCDEARRLANATSKPYCIIRRGRNLIIQPLDVFSGEVTLMYVVWPRGWRYSPPGG